MDALRQNTTLVGNIKAYTLSALYNAPVTMKQYYIVSAIFNFAYDI